MKPRLYSARRKYFIMNLCFAENFVRIGQNCSWINTPFVLFHFVLSHLSFIRGVGFPGQDMYIGILPAGTHVS